MNILLDTQILLWFIFGDKRFTKEMSDYVINPNNEIYYSSVSIWEIAIKHGLHPDYFTFSAKEVSDACHKLGFVNMPLYDKHIIQLDFIKKKDNTPSHKDPFDHMLLSQAKNSRLTLLSSDEKFKYYDENCIIVL